MSTVYSFETQEPIVEQTTDPARVEIPTSPETSGIELAVVVWCNHNERQRSPSCPRGGVTVSLRIAKEPEAWTGQDLVELLSRVHWVTGSEGATSYQIGQTFDRRRRRDPARFWLRYDGKGHRATVVLPGNVPASAIGELVAAAWRFEIHFDRFDKAVTFYRPEDAWTFSRDMRLRDIEEPVTPEPLTGGCR